MVTLVLYCTGYGWGIRQLLGELIRSKSVAAKKKLLTFASIRRCLVVFEGIRNILMDFMDYMCYLKEGGIISSNHTYMYTVHVLGQFICFVRLFCTTLC